VAPDLVSIFVDRFDDSRLVFRSDEECRLDAVIAQQVQDGGELV
jgi:hypothetical protein